MQALELQKVLSHGLLSFPITDFDANGDFNKAGYQSRLEWLAPYGATALFAAGGTGRKRRSCRRVRQVQRVAALPVR